MSKPFPNGFLWGASSSAFQIEGGWDEDGKGMTVADYNSFKRSDKQADSKVASDFYHHWREDIALMKELGLNIYRFSLSWARIIPDGDGEVNPKGIVFYNDVINCLLEHGIQPFVTLYHFDLPYALVEKYNGWENRACAFAFERYAKVCFEAFGDRVKYWQVINEQNLMIRVDERMNIHEPDLWKADKIRAQMDYHMFLGHALAVNACHELVPGGKVGPAVSSTCTYPLTNRPEDVWAAKMNDWFKTNYCLEMHMDGQYPGYYMRYLQERVGERLTVERIARDNLMGVSQLEKLLGKSWGCGAIELFSRIKIDAAKQLIRDGQLNMTQIAERLGYSSLYYFSRQFKKTAAMSPSEYAASIRILSEKRPRGEE